MLGTATKYMPVSPNPFDNLNGYLYVSGTLEAAGPGLKPRQPDLRDCVLLVSSVPSLVSEGSPQGQKRYARPQIMSSLIAQVELRSQSKPVH